jgi:hypothetical protein
LKGQSSYSVSYGKLDANYPEIRLTSAKTKSNIWDSTSPKDSGTLVPKENKLSAQSNKLTTRRQIHEFLGSVGFCWICIPNFSLLAMSLYKATKRGKKEPLVWESEQQAFHAIKEPLVWDSEQQQTFPCRGISQCLCSGTPRCEKAFLYVHERSAMTI